MEVSLVFALAVMFTGEMWTRFEWGVWWTWEPRLTTYLVLVLVVLAYFVLRNAVDDPERRGAFSAVLGLIAFADVPITFAVTRILPSSLHPVVFREGGLAPDMALTVVVCSVGMLALAFVMYRICFRTARLAERTCVLEQREGLTMNPILEEIYSTVIPSAPYLIAAYALVLAALLVWLLAQFRRQSNLSRRLDVLEEEREEREGTQRLG